MHKLYGNNIRLTRGDTLAVAVGLWNADGAEAMYREFYERYNAEQ